jgi:tetratricopeptide (TPR) repeat protein
MGSISTKLSVCALAAVVIAAVAGCGGGSVARWMVDLRSSQGDTALKSGNVAEALGEYDLALRLDPKNAHARAGLAQALTLRAQAEFANSKLEEAGADIAKAHFYAPSDAVTQALAGQIEQATIRREVVVANYPLYGSMATSIGDSLKTIVSTNAQIEKELKKFRADYDTNHLTKAIVESYDLEDEAHRVTLRLTSYRALVQSGAVNRQAAAAADAPNLLPIP